MKFSLGHRTKIVTVPNPQLKIVTAQRNPTLSLIVTKTHTTIRKAA